LAFPQTVTFRNFPLEKVSGQPEAIEMNTNNGTAREAFKGSTSNSNRILNGERPRIENELTGPSGEAPKNRASFGNQLVGRLRQFAIPAAIALAVILILLFGGLFSNQKESVSPAARALDVEVVTAVPESGYQVHRSYLGRIESRRESSLSFEVGGKLVSLTVDEGQTVEPGQVLAQLDTKILRSNRNVIVSRIGTAQAKLDELVAGPRVEDVESARAQVRRWRSQLQLARITSKRLIALNRSKAIAQQEADDAVYNQQVVEAQLDLATSELAELENGTRKEQVAGQQATVNQLKAELGTIDINIEKSQLIAPYRGVVSTRLLDEGEVIASGQPVFELLDNRQLEARVGLPVESVASVTSQARHRLVYHDETIDVTLKSVRPEKNADTRTVDVVFEIKARANPFSIGDTVRLELSETVNETGLWIPSSAMVETYRGLWGCYVAESDEAGSAIAISRLRELEILHQEGELAFVRGGLQPGEQVIVSGVHRLVSDQKVNVANRHPTVASR